MMLEAVVEEVVAKEFLDRCCGIQYNMIARVLLCGCYVVGGGF